MVDPQSSLVGNPPFHVEALYHPQGTVLNLYIVYVIVGLATADDFRSQTIGSNNSAIHRRVAKAVNTLSALLP